MSRKNTSKLDTVEPSICIGSRLKMLTRNVENIYRKHLSPFGITSSQLSILFFVAKRKEVRQRDIANFLSLERSTVSRDLRRLVDNGLLTKNGIRPIVKPTQKGQNVLEEVIPAWKNAHDEASDLLGKGAVSHIGRLTNQLRS